MTDNHNTPAGKSKTTITYLEKRERPRRQNLKPSPGISIAQTIRPTVSFYRFLYNKVGGSWLWYERRQMRDDDLRAIIQNPRVEIYVLYVGGVPAGYAEIDLRMEPDIELAYFDIMPEFIGQRLGPFFIKLGY